LLGSGARRGQGGDLGRLHRPTARERVQILRVRLQVHQCRQHAHREAHLHQLEPRRRPPQEEGALRHRQGELQDLPELLHQGHHADVPRIGNAVNM
jgi:hypothetical protein